MRVTSIAAVAENRVIGKDNDLVWKLRDDMKFFMETTRGHYVIMGRRNYESIPERFRPLADRTNVVITRDEAYVAPGAAVVHSLEDALKLAGDAGETEAFIIGGGQIYAAALQANHVDRQWITHVKAAPEGDTYYPEFPMDEWTKEVVHFQPADERNEFAFEICLYSRK